MNKKKIFVIIVALLVLLVIFLYWLPKQVQVVAAKQQNLQQSVVFLGRVAPAERLELSAPVSAQVKAILVEEGQRVKSQQILLQLEDDLAQQSLLQAKANLQKISLQQQQVGVLNSPTAKNNLIVAKNKFAQAKRELQRTENLVKQKFYAPSKLEDVQRDLAITQAELENAQLQLKDSSSKGVAAQMVNAQLAQAKAELQRQQIELDKLTIKAPVDAVVVSKHTAVGNFASSGSILLKLMQLGDTYIEATLDEKNLALLRTGQTAMVQTDAFVGQKFDAVLDYISPAVDPLRGTVEVKFLVNNPPKFLRPEMTVTVDVLVDKLNNVIAVPKQAVYGFEKKHPWLYLVHDGKIVKQKVQLGLIGTNYVQVVNGLQLGDLVALSSDVEQGTRVRTKLVQEIAN